MKLVRNTKEFEKRASHRKTTAWPAARTNLFNSYEPALVAGTSSIISYHIYLYWTILGYSTRHTQLSGVCTN